MRKSLKALSVKLPWAWLIIQGHKGIENRNYSISWRGTIAIQCSKRIEREDIYQAEELIKERKLRIAIPTLQQLQIFAGKIIGTVDIVDCVEDSDSPWFVGRYGWVLKNPIVLPEPIPHRGSISPILWDVQSDALAQINKQIGSKL